MDSAASGNETGAKSSVILQAQPADESCDVCGSNLVAWRGCKQLCLNCGTILKSCADL